MAVGATPADVLRLVLGDGLRVTLAGVVIGGIVAVVAGRLIRSLLFGITPSDPSTLFAVIGTLLFVASLASLLPARRAARVDPITALRAE
jgi:ABC-type antimicrobial peptide transport system permease subunit